MKKEFFRGKRILKGTVKRKTIPGSKLRTGREPVIILHPDDEYPPEMAKLSDTRKRFVIAHVMFPDKDNAEWARLAGIGGSDRNGRIEVYKLLHDATVVDAIRAYAQNLFGSDAPLYRKKLLEHAKSSDWKRSLKAVEIGLRYTGLTSQQINVKHEHTVELTRDELRAQLSALVKEHPELQIEHRGAIYPDISKPEYDISEQINVSPGGTNCNSNIIEAEFTEPEREAA